jgi:DNA-binding response OmpR family regulator
MRRQGELVLVVEDERNVREPLTHLLRLRHFDVMTADTVAQAVELIAQRTPSAAIVDLQLRRGTGRDVVARVPAAVPVIIFSGVPSESGQLEQLRPRTRFIEKPCSLTWLIDRLAEMLGPQPETPSTDSPDTPTLNAA